MSESSQSEKAAATPEIKRGIFRERGPSLLDQCVFLMERMYMESLNGVLCQVDDEYPRACETCAGYWVELHALLNRYDSGER